MIDKNFDGYLTLNKISEVFTGGLSYQRAFGTQIMNEVDKNRDRVISFAEFETAIERVL